MKGWWSTTVMERSERKYPFWAVTGHVTIGFPLLYVVSFFMIGLAYALLFQVPADQSRSVSHLFYGLLISAIPFFTMGLLLGALLTSFNDAPKVIVLGMTAHVVIWAFVLEKGIGLYLASLIASAGFPDSFYGRGYPAGGMRLLCEELPYYCPPYASTYWLVSPIVGAISFAVGAYAASRGSKRVRKA